MLNVPLNRAMTMAKRSHMDAGPEVLLPYFQLAEELNGRLRDLPRGDDSTATMYMRAWLGALGALVDGWSSSGLDHPAVAPLLAATTITPGRKERLTDLLAVARKDVFRYSGSASPPSIAAFVTTPGALEWAGNLHRAFRSFFLRRSWGP